MTRSELLLIINSFKTYTDGQLESVDLTSNIESYFEENPIDVGSLDISSAVDKYLEENNICVTDSDIAVAMKKFFEANKEYFKGEQGIQGERGFSPSIELDATKTIVTIVNEDSTDKVDLGSIIDTKISEKELVSKTYVDDAVGKINTGVTINAITQEEYDAMDTYENAFYFITE